MIFWVLDFLVVMFFGLMIIERLLMKKQIMVIDMLDLFQLRERGTGHIEELDLIFEKEIKK